MAAAESPHWAAATLDMSLLTGPSPRHPHLSHLPDSELRLPTQAHRRSMGLRENQAGPLCAKGRKEAFLPSPAVSPHPLPLPSTVFFMVFHAGLWVGGPGRVITASKTSTPLGLRGGPAGWQDHVGAQAPRPSRPTVPQKHKSKTDH